MIEVQTGFRFPFSLLSLHFSHLFFHSNCKMRQISIDEWRSRAVKGNDEILHGRKGGREEGKSELLSRIRVHMRDSLRIKMGKKKLSNHSHLSFAVQSYFLELSSKNDSQLFFCFWKPGLLPTPFHFLSISFPLSF